jgi:hypothetical protein
MQRGHVVRRNEIPQVHQSGDGQPTLDPGRALPGGRCTARLKLTNPKIKDAADPDVQQQKRALKTAAHHL